MSITKINSATDTVGDWTIAYNNTCDAIPITYTGGTNNIETILGANVIGGSASYSILITRNGTINGSNSISSVFGGSENTITSSVGATNAGIFCGSQNSLLNGIQDSCIIGGLSNEIDGSAFSVILGGSSNQITNTASSSAIIAGDSIVATRTNTAYANNLQVVGGTLGFSTGGTNSIQYCGKATLSAGSVIVNTAGFVSGQSIVFLTNQSPSGSVGTPYISSSANGTFTITSTLGGVDNSVIGWMIVNDFN